MSYHHNPLARSGPPARLSGAPALPPRLDSALPFSRSLVSVDLDGGARVDLHLLEHGDRSGPPVLFVHGNRSWSATWRQVMARCAQLRVVAIDLPGFGLSGDLPAGRRTLEGYGETVARLVEQLELEHAVVVAHEAGGLIAARAGRRLASGPAKATGTERGAPSRFALGGLVLVASALPPSAAPAGASREPGTLHRFGAAPRLRDRVFAAAGWPPLALDALQSDRAGFARNAAELYAWPLRWAARRRAMVELAAIAAEHSARRDAGLWLLDFPGPLALVWGHRDPLMTADDFATQERELPYARIWRTEAGHFVQEEAADGVAQAIAWTVEQVGRSAGPEGAPDNFLPGMGGGDFDEVGRTHLRHMVELGGLGRDDRILDLGCGLGRTAHALREFLLPGGRYDGIDIVRDVVRWCQQTFTRVDARLRFHHAPVRSGLYSPQGTVDAREYRFPFEDGSFDFVLAESLFTHLEAAEARHYLAEVARVLRPGGTLCVSAFLLDPASRAAIARGTSDHRFATALGEQWIEDPEQPLLAVGFERGWFLEALAAAGLEPRGAPTEGAWRGSAPTITYQDVVIAVRRRGAP